jgi:1-acyl-sn-glycerol-3-phosphate acyltransferase
MSGRAYYAGKAILVTGATGLVGKALIETVLRALPEVRRVYLLVRSRRDAVGRPVSVEQRLQRDVFASSAFDALRAQHGAGFAAFVESKVEAVEGELERDRLGLDADTYRRLQDDVDVVIGNGALAVFDAPLDQAVQTNALGPMRLLDFARGAARRPFVAHVSTCYVGNVAGPVFEAPLAPDWTPAGPDATDPYDVDGELGRLLDHVAMLRSAGHGTERRLVDEGLRWAQRRGWRDTYTFTKAMGEQLFSRHRGDVPGLILRPSIIESALRTPTPGWIDGYRMMDPLIVGYARRQLTAFPGDPEAILDVVPVDTVVNALLMAIPFAHTGEGPEVYQVASGVDNPLRMKTFCADVRDHYLRSPLRPPRSGADEDLPPLALSETERFLRRLEVGHLRPTRVLEAIFGLLQSTAWGRRQRAVLSARRARMEWLHRMARIYGPYAENRSRFMAFNVQRAWRSLSDADRAAFPFDVRSLDWTRYVQQVHLPGVERFLLRRSDRVAPIDLAEAATPAASGAARAAAERAVAVPTLATYEAKGTVLVAEAGVPRVAAPPFGNTAAARGDPGAAREATAATATEGSRPLRGARSGWRPAEQVLALTRETRPAEASAWTNPTYKRYIRRASLHAIRLAARMRLELAWEGREHVPARGPFIVVANHTSHVDTGVLLTALGPLAETTQPTAAADYWFRRPAVAWLLHATLGGIPFDRQRRNVARALALPAQVLRNGHALIFYPEGTRSLDGTLQPFRSTVGLLALASAAPIVPAAISGAAQALPKGRLWIAHHPVRVRFGPPIPMEPYLTRLDHESVASVARSVAQDAHDAVASLRSQGTLPLEEARP